MAKRGRLRGAGGPRRGLLRLVLLAAVCAALSGCGGEAPPGGAQLLLDGAAWSGEAVSPEDTGVRVYITLDGAPLIDLPFSEPHTLTVSQPGIGENTVEITGSAVRMAHADCENQDCVQMGDVTLENLELRVMGGFIVCLPHKLSVEVRGD